MESLLALRDRPLFAHLARLESCWPRTLDLHLDSPDPLLLHLLAEPVAAILPRELKGEAGFALQPVGTGPYRVTANNPLQLCLEAFDDYFGLRALLDEIDIWMLPELAERLESHLQLGATAPSSVPCAASPSSNPAATSCCRTTDPPCCRIPPCANG